ncbi:BNR repeat protein [Anseongella ginsenosidimutans]|uniref:exo-alpha-sialidase n=1 Tax=Anseongella ginsenosidimutans TaxID=496056 RepID=A0A4R3KND3_9SPHI|nr:exo-alpha-sialidase [Anseongella ginsenosidimutans]TCS86003.1 BNR repeat protein [Anseongella ginsenosidimutans]
MTFQYIISSCLLWFLLLLLPFAGNAQSNAGQAESNGGQTVAGVRKIKDLVIYKDARFYSSFPSVVRKQDGELLVAFRRAPDRTIFGEKGNMHVDPNSYLVMVRSADGETWTAEPELLYAHPFGGSQDPCLLQLRNGTLLCASYGWAFVRPDGIPNLKKPVFQAGPATFLGGYLLRSTDGGDSWEPPVYPPQVPVEKHYNAYGIPLPAYNRGALYEGADGRIYWAVAATDTSGRTSVHMLISDDEGRNWQYTSPVAADEKVAFNETSVYETPKGDVVAFLRTAGFDDQACIARSKDGGKTFGKWESMGFRGHPLNALRLPDNRVLLTYGYRHPPFGIRARILNAECTDFETAPEIILREDGGNGDIGYTWPVQLDKHRVLVVYYFNKDNKTRYIAGTILEID